MLSLGKKASHFNQLLKKSNFLEISNCLKWNRVLTYLFAFFKQFNFYGDLDRFSEGLYDVMSFQTLDQILIDTNTEIH